MLELRPFLHTFDLRYDPLPCHQARRGEQDKREAESRPKELRIGIREVERDERSSRDHRAEQQEEGEILGTTVWLTHRSAWWQRALSSPLAEQQHEQGDEPALHGASFLPSMRMTSRSASRPINQATIPSGTGPTSKSAQPPGFCGCFAYWT